MDSTSQVTRLKGTKVQQDKLDQPLPRKFYARDPREVSRDLLGKILFRRDDTSLRAGRIVEVEAFGITRERDNGKDVTSTKSDLWIADDGYRPAQIVTTTRIGITKAAKLPLRYLIAGNPFVSGPKTAT